MKDKKLLEKVKKGLDCCCPFPCKCDECPYKDEVGGSCKYLTIDSRLVINDLEEQVRKLKSENQELKNNIDHYKADIEDLEFELASATGLFRDAERKNEVLYNELDEVKTGLIKKKLPSNTNTCVCCGKEIPEGMMVCLDCMEGVKSEGKN